SGSRVVAQRADGCTPDAAAIPWLLLDSVSNGGHGIFANISHIQRLNTVGGLKPSTPGSTIGEEARVPYTAEDFFYQGAGKRINRSCLARGLRPRCQSKTDS